MHVVEAAALRDLRRARGWTQRDLADELGTDVATVSRWERGISRPQRRLRVALAALVSAARMPAATPGWRPSASAAVSEPAADYAARGTPASQDPGIDELVRIVGLEPARRALRRLALHDRAPRPVVFPVDPMARLRELEAALGDQEDLIARARID